MSEIRTGNKFRLRAILDCVDTLDIEHLSDDQLMLRQLTGFYKREKAIVAKLKRNLK